VVLSLAVAEAVQLDVADCDWVDDSEAEKEALTEPLGVAEAVTVEEGDTCRNAYKSACKRAVSLRCAASASRVSLIANTVALVRLRSSGTNENEQLPSSSVASRA
jgi:hypothetical protein